MITTDTLTPAELEKLEKRTTFLALPDLQEAMACTQDEWNKLIAVASRGMASTFDEDDFNKPDGEKRFHNEILAAHPINTYDHATYHRALELISERHAKYDLVDLVNWLITLIPGGLPAPPSTETETEKE